MGVHDFTIYDIICRNARLYPQEDSIIYNDTRLNHGDFKVKCDQLSAGLIKEGVEKGDRVAVVAHNSDEYMILYGACAKIGAVVLAVNWRYSKEEVEYVLNDCTPKIVFAGSDFIETISDVKPHVSSIKKCFTIGSGEKSDKFQPLTTLFTEDGSQTEFDINGDSGFIIIHTAAVEGKPRGALLSQSNVVYTNLHFLYQYKLDKNDCHLGLLPFFHIAGIALAFAVMHGGGKNTIMEKFDGDKAVELINNEGVTTFYNFSPILSMIMDSHEKRKEFELSTIRHLSGLDSGENIKRFLELVPSATYHTGFAQTEAMGVTACPVNEKPGSSGKPTEIAKVALFDDNDNEVPVGEEGEICVKSPTVFKGYWGLEDETAHTFRNGWHHTGDIGKFDDEGYLYYVKRKAQKELIKPGGENVYPQEVENAILKNENISETCVIGVPDKKWGEAIKAVCVLKPGKNIDSEELIEFVASNIARYKKPHHIVYVDSLPGNEDGEVDREKIKKDHGSKY